MLYFFKHEATATEPEKWTALTEDRVHVGQVHRVGNDVKVAFAGPSKISLYNLRLLLDGADKIAKGMKGNDFTI